MEQKRMRKVSLVTFVVAALAFLLPFVTFSCAGQKVGSLTGINLVAGRALSEASGPGQFLPKTVLPAAPAPPERLPPDGLAIVALAAALVGIGLCFGKKYRLERQCTIAGAAGLVLLNLLKYHLQSEALNHTHGLITVSGDVGWYLSSLAFLAAAAVNGWAWYETRKLRPPGALAEHPEKKARAEPAKGVTEFGPNPEHQRAPAPGSETSAVRRGGSVRIPRYALWIIMATAVIVAVGLSYKHFHDHGTTSQAAATAGDATITRSIEAKLFQNPTLKERAIQVSSQSGVVTLIGSVASGIEKLAVEGVASGTPGVHQVVDRLSIATATKPEARGMTRPHAGLAHVVEQPRLPAMRRAPASRPEAARAERAASAAAVAKTAPYLAYAPTLGASPTTAARAPKSAPPTVARALPKLVPPPPIVVPNGYQVHVRLIDSIDSRTAQPDETYAASVAAPTTVNAKVVFPVGTDCRVRLVEVHQGGRFSGSTSLRLALASITFNGVTYPTTSGYYNAHSSGRGKRTAETIGGGAGLGALIGAIGGRGKGAAIGAGAGAAAGGIIGSLRKPRLRVSSETLIDFTLSSPIIVKPQAVQP